MRRVGCGLVFELKKFLRENEVNAFVSECEGAEGFEFIEKVLDYFNASYSAIGREIERIPSEGRVVIIANHTLGLVDGAALLKLVGQVRRDVRVVAKFWSSGDCNNLTRIATKDDIIVAIAL